MNLDQFAGVNAAYVLELYERYRQDPQSVDPATRTAFESWTPT
jgi:2-oxoglutarate dehydrogenase E1 component